MSHETEFAVVDLETTGLYPQGHDRIVEIAIVRVDALGAVLSEYATLVNPLRDIGPTPLHGITAGDVKRAPRFEEIAGDVLSRLAGAVFAAHNAVFDNRFLRSEFNRLDCTLPTVTSLCTMRLARRVDPEIPSRQLGQLCTHFGISHSEAHLALGDARATASLLASCLGRLGAGTLAYLSEIGTSPWPVSDACWPSLRATGRSYQREDAARESSLQPSYIGHLVARLPAAPHPDADLEDYATLLDRALEDRRVTSEEAGELLSLAEELGIGRESAIRVHHEYMRDLIRVALEDGIITQAERDDLDEVRILLNISATAYKKLCDEVEQRQEDDGSASTRSGVDVEGQSVCFTGTFACCVGGAPATRALAEKIALDRGMVIKKAVTKKLDYLVTADPDSMSGKATKARKYGIRIIAEPVFWRMVGMQL